MQKLLVTLVTQWLTVFGLGQMAFSQQKTVIDFEDLGGGGWIPSDDYKDSSTVDIEFCPLIFLILSSAYETCDWSFFMSSIKPAVKH
jgi:hypothetical protein